MKAPFDIFISFKATDNGLPTEDVGVATELYRALSKRGYRVFFSSETLEKGGSSDFSREIDAALDEARVLIVVATNPHYPATRWVEYEWKSFNNDVLSGLKEGQIITYTRNVSTHDLPRVLRYVQNYDVEHLDGLLSLVDAFFEKGEGMPIPKTATDSTPAAVSAAVRMDRTMYNSAAEGQMEILRLAAKRNYTADLEAIAEAKSRLGGGSFRAMTLGCAYGFLAETRFGLDDDVQTVYCIDKNPDVLEMAREIYRNYPHMRFIEAELQKEDYPARIRGAMEEDGFRQLDIVFASGLFRYLTDPMKVLKSTRRLMKSGGILILRDCDDGTATMHPDPEGRWAEVENRSADTKGMPNYHVARELPTLLSKCGFEVVGVRLASLNSPTLSYDEKEDWFLSSFGQRREIAKQVLAAGNREAEKLITAIDRFEEVFFDRDLFFSESDLILLARKV